MRLVLIFALVASVLAEPVPIARNYHEEQGIPRAEEIRVAEELAAKNPTPEQRIVGGSLAPANEHPYLAGLLINLAGTSSISVCGASLVSANRLVTAAHCWFDGWNQATLLTVVLGTHTLFSGGTRVTTSHVVMHGSWNPNTFQHDIAMIYLSNNVPLSNSIAPVALPDGLDLFLTFYDHTAVAAGYGRTSDQQVGIPTNAAVSHVAVRIVSTFDCQALYGMSVTDWNICTDGIGGRGICSGDSGGPLVLYSQGRRVLVGVSSFTAAAGCQVSFPSGFTRVTSYINFIRQHL